MADDRLAMTDDHQEKTAYLIEMADDLQNKANHFLDNIPPIMVISDSVRQTFGRDPPWLE